MYTTSISIHTGATNEENPPYKFIIILFQLKILLITIAGQKLDSKERGK